MSDVNPKSVFSSCPAPSMVVIKRAIASSTARSIFIWALRLLFQFLPATGRARTHAGLSETSASAAFGGEIGW